MGFEFFIARRYLRSKRSIQFVSIINLVSVIGITVGVAALLVVLSVFNGFTGIVTSLLISFDPHLRIERSRAIEEAEAEEIQEFLKQQREVAGFSPFVTGKGMVVSRSFGKVVYVKGVDEQKIGSASGIKDKIVLGGLTLQDSGGVGGIVLGLMLADRLGAVVGDEVAIVSPYTLGAVMPFAQVAPMKFRVSGIFESNNKDYDANYAFVSIPAAQALFHQGEHLSGIEVRLSDIGLVERTQRMLRERFAGYEVSSWYDLHKDLYSVMKIERWVAYIILCLIILVATFNMLGSLTMSVIEKRRDIGVLKAMGANGRSITRIFMFDGLLVGIAGTVFGILLGLLLLYLQTEYHLFPLDTTVFIIPAIPVEIRLEDFLSVSVASLLLSALASYYPARRAANVVPIEAIRWE